MLSHPLTARARAAVSRQIVLACLLALAAPAAWSLPILSAAQSFAVLGGAAVTNTGPTTINGDIGVAPGTSVTGMESTTVFGTVHSGDAAAVMAHLDAAAASGYLSGLAFTQDLTGMDLGGMTLLPGVYLITSSAQLTGALILDAQNLANALFVFQIGSTLTTATGSSVQVINGSADTGVFFDIGTSAVLGTGTQLAGNLVASDSITFNTAATLLCGRALAVNGAVTLDTNSLSNDCGSGDFGSNGYSGLSTAAADVPEPATWSLLALGMGGVAWCSRRRQSGRNSA